MADSPSPVRASAQEQAEQLEAMSVRGGVPCFDAAEVLPIILAAEARGRQQAERQAAYDGAVKEGERILREIADRCADFDWNPSDGNDSADPADHLVANINALLDRVQQAEQARDGDNTLGANPFRTWKQVAQRVGEELSDNGPDGYYDFDPAEWQDWCLEQLGRLAGKPTVAALTQALKDYRPIIELVRELQHASASLVHDSPETYSAYGLAVAKLLKAKLPAPPSPERRHE